ncbi:hypothetical protein [Burkholderia lata]|uniref:hypothetical protein n=1 Tax=Burkholderia lata (strain ATCC 17760 / DSM 23089 / LMG 22485 / NCIMB 9086 / R18194 / 383) TaxID=482957 RepID=UPI001583A297|nr:hypothetical protein [Burkholderia lata]
MGYLATFFGEIFALWDKFAGPQAYVGWDLTRRPEYREGTVVVRQHAVSGSKRPGIQSRNKNS